MLSTITSYLPREESSMKIGEVITAIRKSYALDQSQFAEPLKISRNYLCLVETGKRKPSEKLIARIATVYSISYGALKFLDTVVPKELSKTATKRYLDLQINVAGLILNSSNVKKTLFTISPGVSKRKIKRKSKKIFNNCENEEMTPSQRKELKEELLAKLTMFTTGKSSVISGWVLMANALMHIIERKLYKASGYDDWREYFRVRLNVKPSDIANILSPKGVFGKKSTVNLSEHQFTKLLANTGYKELIKSYKLMRLDAV